MDSCVFRGITKTCVSLLPSGVDEGGLTQLSLLLYTTIILLLLRFCHSRRHFSRDAPLSSHS